MRKVEARPFEVYCNRCGVSFATGTRKCVHCGARTSRQPGQIRVLPPSVAHREAESMPELLLPPAGEEQDIEEDAIRRKGLFSPVAVLWIMLAIAGALYRACGGAPA